MTYQGYTIVSSKGCNVIVCDSSFTQGASSTDAYGFTSRTWCCTSDNCNLSSTISSNKLLTGLSILLATLVAFFKSN